MARAEGGVPEGGLSGAGAVVRASATREELFGDALGEIALVSRDFNVLLELSLEVGDKQLEIGNLEVGQVALTLEASHQSLVLRPELSRQIIEIFIAQDCAH